MNQVKQQLIREEDQYLLYYVFIEPSQSGVILLFLYQTWWDILHMYGLP